MAIGIALDSVWRCAGKEHHEMDYNHGDAFRYYPDRLCPYCGAMMSVEGTTTEQTFHRIGRQGTREYLETATAGQFEAVRRTLMVPKGRAREYTIQRMLTKVFSHSGGVQ